MNNLSSKIDKLLGISVKLCNTIKESLTPDTFNPTSFAAWLRTCYPELHPRISNNVIIVDTSLWPSPIHIHFINDANNRAKTIVIDDAVGSTMTISSSSPDLEVKVRDTLDAIFRIPESNNYYDDKYR